MPLHKKTVSGDIADTLTYTIPTGDAYGAQVIDVRFFDGSGNAVEPTGGTFALEWTPNGRDWQRFHSALAPVKATAPVGDWQVSGFVGGLRAVPTSITGADSWEVSYRTHGIGYSFPHHTIAPLRFFDRMRTLNQTLLETATLEGDSYRIYAFFGDKSPLADLGDEFPAIPGMSSVWVSVSYSTTKFTTIANRVLALFAGEGLKYTAYAPGTPFTGAGTPIAVRNLENNLGPSKPADATAFYLGTVTPPQFTGATEIDFAIVPRSSGGGGNAGGNRLPDDQFIVPPIGGETLVQIYNPSNQAVEVRFEIQITETTI